MTRRSRTLQFFASADEVGSVLEDCWSLGLCVHAVEDLSVSRLDRPDRPGATVRRVLIGPAAEVPDDAHRQPARHGLVVLDLPRRVHGDLQMAGLSAVNVWTVDEEGFEDDRALKTFELIKRALRSRLTGTVYVISRSNGSGRHYPAIRSTDAAVAEWRAGVRWTQEGVSGLEFRPSDEDGNT